MPLISGSEGFQSLRRHCTAGALAALALTGQAGCALEKAETTQLANLDAQVVGCAMLQLDGTCTLDARRTLRFFVPAPWAGGAQFRGEGVAIEVTKEAEVDGGVRVAIKVPMGVSRIELSSRAGGTLGRFQIELRDEAVSVVLDRANELRHGGSAEKAAEYLRANMPPLLGIERARAEGLLARIELALGRNLVAQKSFERAIILDRAHGLVSLETLDGCSLAFLMVTRLYQFEEAQVLLDATRAAAMQTADGRARFPYFEALLDLELGDLRRALERFRTSRERAERLGLVLHEWTARDRIAAVLQLLGRTAEAIAELEALRAAPSRPVSACERADVLINLGWYYIERPTSTQDELGRAKALLEQARSMFPDRCSDPFRHAVASTNLAYAAERLGALASARAYLAQARHDGDQEGSLSVWWLLLEGRIALDEQRAMVARGAFERAARLAQTLLLPELGWRALVGLGASLERLGESASALTVYEEAEVVLEKHALFVPLGEGRAAFLAAHDVSAQARIELLLRHSGASAAFAAARGTRARLLHALADTARLTMLDASRRKRWTQAMASYARGRAALLDDAQKARDLPVDQLAAAELLRTRREATLLSNFERELAALALLHGAEPFDPAPLGLTLMYRPLRTGFIAFASSEQGVEARVLGEEPPEHSDLDRSRWLLTPFFARITAASRVRVLAEGKLAEVDFHALPFGAGPLIMHAAVTYPLDLPAIVAPVREAREVALVVSDPSRDLPLAREEARTVSAALRRRSFNLNVLEGDRATTRSVSAAVRLASHIHFAGHALFAGQDGFQSVLRLARGETMSMADVLSVPISASVVILSGCEAGQTQAGDQSGLGVASAFALAGAQAVIAPTRRVDDSDAFVLMNAMYESANDLTHADWAEALRSAQIATPKQHPAIDWAAFRVLTR